MCLIMKSAEMLTKKKKKERNTTLTSQIAINIVQLLAFTLDTLIEEKMQVN